MLVKVDRASMANGLEVRPPFLDHELVEWAARLPTDKKIQGFEGKAILKSVLEPMLPREVLYRPKQGFSVPLSAWLRGEFDGRIRDLVADSPLSNSGLFDTGFLRRLADEHRSGRRDHSRTLWALVMFDAFLRRPWAETTPTAGGAPRRAVA
jgi:asparagine synthase (glutamine-hydrolysing)